MPATTTNLARLIALAITAATLAACNLPGDLASDAAEQRAAAAAIVAEADAADRPLTPGEAAAVAALREGATLSGQASESLLSLSDATVGGLAAAVLAGLGVWGTNRSRKASRLGRIIAAATDDDAATDAAIRSAARRERIARDPERVATEP
jgi:hypothetical protein